MLQILLKSLPALHPRLPYSGFMTGTPCPLIDSSFTPEGRGFPAAFLLLPLIAHATAQASGS